MTRKFHATKVKSKLTALEPAKPFVLQNFSRELYEALRIYLLVAQISGCAPCAAHRLDSKPNQALTTTHLSWCAFVYACIACSIYFEHRQDQEAKNLSAVQEPLYFSEYIFYLVHAAQIMLTTQLYRHKFRSFLERIIAFDLRLACFNVAPKYGLLRRFLHQHLWLILAHFIITSIFTYLYSDGAIIDFLRGNTVYILANIIIEISLAQYYALLYAIALRCIQLNKVLRLELTQHFGPPLTLHRHLQELRLLHAHLESFTKDINDTFGWSIFLVYAGSYTNLSSNIFLVYKYIDGDEDTSLPWALYGVVWCCMHTGKMFLILYYNHCVQSQKSTTASLLNDFRAHCAVMRETVQHFLLQLSVNTRSSVVCGVVTLSLELVTTLLTSLSTLFIFLLQYDITLEALTQAAVANKTTKLA